MAKLLDSATGAKMVIASADHCPPHVHASHKGEGWVVRLGFSYASNAAEVLSIAPTEGAVRQKQLNRMLDEIVSNLQTCRELWWNSNKTTCLENQWVLSASSELCVLSKDEVGAKQVWAADYDVATQKLVLKFWDGSEHPVEGAPSP